jgi:hypothetical protein
MCHASADGLQMLCWAAVKGRRPGSSRVFQCASGTGSAFSTTRLMVIAISSCVLSWNGLENARVMLDSSGYRQSSSYNTRALVSDRIGAPEVALRHPRLRTGSPPKRTSRLRGNGLLYTPCACLSGTVNAAPHVPPQKPWARNFASKMQLHAESTALDHDTRQDTAE